MKRILNFALIAVLCFGPAVALAAPGHSGDGGNNGNHSGMGGGGSNGQGGGDGGNGGHGGHGGNGGGNGNGGNGGGEGGNGGGSTGGGASTGASVSGDGGASVSADGNALVITGGEGISDGDLAKLVAAIRKCEMTRPGLAIGDYRGDGSWFFATFDDTVWPYVQRCMKAEGYPANGADFTETTDFGDKSGEPHKF